MSVVVDIARLAEKMKQAGVPADYGPDLSRLLVRIWEELAKGKPISKARENEIADEVAVPKDKASEFLKRHAERNDDDNIIGILGLTQNRKWPHRFIVDGKELRTWCAWDTLFLAQVLHQEVRVESESPVSGAKIVLTVGPEKVESYSPESSVISIVTIDPDKQDSRKLEELWCGL